MILVSLDGASAETLQQLHKEGALTAGGFERFYSEGQVAERMVPVNPTITAVNHISLVTGYPPAQTGIVSNRFHARRCAVPGDGERLRGADRYRDAVGSRCRARASASV